jgi:hypothetical protein
MATLSKLKYIVIGDEVQVFGDWYPVIGYSLLIERGNTTGSVFSSKKYGNCEPCLGYRINYSDITAVRPSNQGEE